MILGESGPMNDAQRALETALSLDPAAASVGRNLARLMYLRGDWPTTLELMEKIRQVEGEFAYWANMSRFVMWRRDDDLVVKLVDMVKGTETSSPIQQAIVDALIDKRSPFVSQRFQQAFGTDGGWRRAAYFRQLEIELASYVGDHERAEAALVACAQTGLIDLLWMDHCPLLDPYRASTEFAKARAIVAGAAGAVIEALRTN
jgi:serine/threonine-protein kinase